MKDNPKLEKTIGYCIMATLQFTLIMLFSIFIILPICFIVFTENQAQIATIIIFFVSLFGAISLSLIAKIKKTFFKKYLIKRRLTKLLIDKSISEAIDYIAENLHEFFIDVKPNEEGSKALKRKIAALWLHKFLHDLE